MTVDLQKSIIGSDIVQQLLLLKMAVYYMQVMRMKTIIIRSAEQFTWENPQKML